MHSLNLLSSSLKFLVSDLQAQVMSTFEFISYNDNSGSLPPDPQLPPNPLGPPTPWPGPLQSGTVLSKQFGAIWERLGALESSTRSAQRSHMLNPVITLIPAPALLEVQNDDISSETSAITPSPSAQIGLLMKSQTTTKRYIGLMRKVTPPHSIRSFLRSWSPSISYHNYVDFGKWVPNAVRKQWREWYGDPG